MRCPGGVFSFAADCFLRTADDDKPEWMKFCVNYVQKPRSCHEVDSAFFWLETTAKADHLRTHCFLTCFDHSILFKNKVQRAVTSSESISSDNPVMWTHERALMNVFPLSHLSKSGSWISLFHLVNIKFNLKISVGSITSQLPLYAKKYKQH